MATVRIYDSLEPLRPQRLNLRDWSGSIFFFAAFATVALLTTLGAVGLRGEGDFVHFHAAAVAVLQGADLYASGSGGYIYPPLPALLMAPLGLLPLNAAGVLWVVASGVILLAALRLLAAEALRRLDRPTSASFVWLAAFLGLLFNVDKARAVLSLGQTDIATFGLLVLALASQLKRPWVTGMLLGVAFNIKYQSIVFLPYFLLRGRWREAAGFTIGVAAGLLSGAFVFGWDTNLAYLARAFQGLVGMIGGPADVAAARIAPLNWMRSISIPSFAARWAGTSSLPILRSLIPAAAALVALMVLFTVYRHRRVPALTGRGGAQETQSPLAAVALLEWSALVVLVLVFSPQSTGRHLFLATFATVVAASVLTVPALATRQRVLLVAGLLLFFVGSTLPASRELVIVDGTFQDKPWTWRWVGGASWCALAAALVFSWVGLKAAAKSKRQIASAPAHFVDATPSRSKAA